MTDGDVDRFVEVLDERRGKKLRVPIADIWVVFADLFRDAFRAEDNRARLRALLDAAADRGSFALSRKSERAGLVALPAFVTFPRPGRPPAPPRRTVVWHPRLAWADAVKLSDPTFEQLTAINRWLRDGGDREPIIAETERAYQLFRRERAIADLKRSSLWGPSGLNHRLLRCVPQRLLWTRVGSGQRALVAENLATYQSLARALSEVDGHAYGGVIYGMGSFAQSKEIGGLIELPFGLSAVDYFGDLDARGLEIGARFCANMIRLELDARPHPTLWAMLLDKDPIAGPPVDRGLIDHLVAWLPPALRERAAAILREGSRIPQEAVGYIELSRDPAWAYVKTTG